MRSLYLDVYHKYLGPAKALTPALLAGLGEVVFFGPGYVERAVLKKGIQEFIKENKSFDLVAASELFLFSPEGKWQSKEFKKYLKNNWSLSFPLNDLDYCEDLENWFHHYQGLKLGILMGFDPYALTEAQIAKLKAKNCYLVTMLGKTFMKPLAAVEQLNDENFTQANNFWYDFVNEFQSKIIELPFWIAAHEFSFNALNHRPHDWVIAGVPYADRKIARQKLKAQNIEVKGLFLARWINLLTKIGLPLTSTELGIALLQTLFADSLQSAKYSYTCGSRLAYPVRKFFEIPAKGTVLVCSPCQGFKELGFKDGQNAFICPPEKIIEIHKQLEQNPDKAQTVASAGLKLILEKHTLYKRIEQLQFAVDAVLKNQYQGCSWQNGDFLLNQ